MGFRALTGFIVAVHFAYLGYVVFGGFLAWRWPRAVWPHIIAVAWGVVIVVADLLANGLTCPLTYAEDWSRQRAGEPPLTVGFIDRYIEGVLYPQRFSATAQILAGLVVVVAWVGARVARGRRLRVSRR